MLTTQQLIDKAAAAEASFKAKVRGVYATIGMGVAAGAQFLTEASNHILGWLPSVQGFIKAEYFQAIGALTAGMMGASSVYQAWVKVKSDRKALAEAVAKADAPAAVAPVAAESVVVVAPVAETVTVSAPQEPDHD